MHAAHHAQMDNATTCCRHYTIRLPVAEFSASKSQRRLLRRWERFLAGEPGLRGAASSCAALSCALLSAIKSVQH
jgi:arginyl-tRNA--protein-N-Asp/Glu arginylyltransferase